MNQQTAQPDPAMRRVMARPLRWFDYRPTWPQGNVKTKRYFQVIHRSNRRLGYADSEVF